MSPRKFAGIIAILMFVTGVVGLFLPLTAATTSGVKDCGSAATPDRQDNPDCEHARDTRNAWALPLIAASIGVGIGVLVVHRRRPVTHLARGTLVLPLQRGDRFRVAGVTWRVVGVPQDDARAVIEDRRRWHPHDVIARDDQTGAKKIFTHEFLTDCADAL